jgi:hypothetical protein
MQEIALAICGWIPALGAGCDAYDVGRSASEGDEVGVLLGAVGFLPFGDFSKFGKQFDRVVDIYKTADSIRKIDPAKVVEELMKLKGTPGGFKADANIAAATVDVDGVDPMLLASVSGQKTRDGMVPEVGPHNPQRYIPRRLGKTEKNNRTTDSEFKILNYVANKLGPSSPNARGTVRLHSELPVCDSCQSVLSQFRADFPNVRVIVTTTG